MPLAITYNADLKKISEQKLYSFNLEFDHNQDPIYQLNNWYNRAIPQQPRSILESKTLAIPSEALHTYNFLKYEIVRGRNLNKFLQKTIINANFSDGYLNDLDLYHFHLGEGYDNKNKGFIARSGFVAIAKVTQTEVIILSIENHNKKTNPDFFYDYKILEILHFEFPSYISNFKIDSSINYQIENIQDRKKYRKTNYNFPIIMSDGTSYIQPGLGVDASGNSLKAKIKSFQYIHIFNMIREFITPFICELQQLNKNYISNCLTVTLLNTDKFSAILRLNYGNKNSILYFDFHKNMYKSISLEKNFITSSKFLFTFDSYAIACVENSTLSNTLIMVISRDSKNDFTFPISNPSFEKELLILSKVNYKFKKTINFYDE